MVVGRERVGGKGDWQGGGDDGGDKPWDKTVWTPAPAIFCDLKLAETGVNGKKVEVVEAEADRPLNLFH